MQKKVLVCGAGGFIGHHLVNRLKSEGFWVRGVDIKYPEFSETEADDFIIGDLRKSDVCRIAVQGCADVYQLAADMGGMGYICGDNDLEIIHNSALINLNMTKAAEMEMMQKMFFSSSACVYPQHNQQSTDHPDCSESSVYPANPDSEYGWEKLFAERLYTTLGVNSSVQTRIARLHNIFGPEGTWDGGREKAPAALCRKVAMAKDGEIIEIWGDGKQTRSFLYIDDCIDGIRKLMESDVSTPINIGTEEMISIYDLALLTADIAGKSLSIRSIDGPQGVRGRNSDNTLIRKLLQWEPSISLKEGLTSTYHWIEQQVHKREKVAVAAH